MSMSIKGGWVSEATPKASENFHTIEDREISLLVIHCISLPPGEFGGDYIDQFFTNQLDPKDHPFFQKIYDMRVASHFFIDRLGQLTQYVSINDCAHHAGVSEFEGRAQCNDFSIGIELEGTDKEKYTEAQYKNLIPLTQLLMKECPLITADRIVGHSDIAPGRKTDPGPGFDWDRFEKGLSHQG